MRAEQGRRNVLLTLVLAAAVGASAGDPGVPSPAVESRLAWVAEIRDNADFRPHRNLLGKAVDLLTGGAEPVALIRPHGLDLAGDVLLVADPDAGRVHRFDLEEKTWSCLPTEGRLASPVAAALGPDGTIWVSEAEAGRVSVFSAEGALLFTCSLGEGRPAGLAWDAGRHRLVVADVLQHRLVLLAADGRLLGEIGGRGTGPGQFNFPVDVAVMPGGGLAVLDALNFRVQLLDDDGRPVGEFGVQGDVPGCLARPRAVAADPHGNLLITDAQTDLVQLFDPQGRLLLVAGGTGKQAGRFWMPAGVAVATDGRVAVADAFNHRVQLFRLVDQEEGQEP